MSTLVVQGPPLRRIGKHARAEKVAPMRAHNLRPGAAEVPPVQRLGRRDFLWSAARRDWDAPQHRQKNTSSRRAATRRTESESRLSISRRRGPMTASPKAQRVMKRMAD